MLCNAYIVEYLLNSDLLRSWLQSFVNHMACSRFSDMIGTRLFEVLFGI